MKELSELDENAKGAFLIKAREHFKSACAHVIKKSALGDKFLAACRCLQPEERCKPASVRRVAFLARALPLVIDVDQLQTEWSMLPEGHIVSVDSPIDEYWAPYFELKDHAGELRFPNVATVVKAVLSLSHGNAEVERGFSDSGRYLTEDKSKMCERSLNAAMTVKSALKNYNNRPELVPSCKELTNLARNACASYKSYLEDEKKKKEEEEKKKKDDILKKKEAEAVKLKISTDISDLKSEEEELKHLKKNIAAKRKIESKLYEEAAKKLKTALKKNDLAEVAVATTLLEGASKVRQEAIKSNDKVETVEKKVNQKKSQLISNFFKKV